VLRNVKLFAVCLLHDFPSSGSASQLMDTDTTRNDGQVGGEAALRPKLAQNGIIAGHDLQKDFRCEVFGVFRSQGHAAQVARVMNDVIDQAQEAVNEIVPSARLMPKTAL